MKMGKNAVLLGISRLNIDHDFISKNGLKQNVGNQNSRLSNIGKNHTDFFLIDKEMKLMIGIENVISFGNMIKRYFKENYENWKSTGLLSELRIISGMDKGTDIIGLIDERLSYWYALMMDHPDELEFRIKIDKKNYFTFDKKSNLSTEEYKILWNLKSILIANPFHSKLVNFEHLGFHHNSFVLVYKYMNGNEIYYRAEFIFQSGNIYNKPTLHPKYNFEFLFKQKIPFYDILDQPLKASVIVAEPDKDDLENINKKNDEISLLHHRNLEEKLEILTTENNSMRIEEFANLISSTLQVSNKINDFIIMNYHNSNFEDKTLIINGFSYTEELDRVDLLVVIYDQTDNIKIIGKDIVLSLIHSLILFIKKCQYENYQDELELSSEIHTLAELLQENKEVISDININIISNSCIKDHSIISNSVNERSEIHFSYNIIDIYKVGELLNQMAQDEEEIDIDFSRYGFYPKFLNENFRGGSMEYESYIFIIPGIILAKMYETFGSKLLEKNVRSFLQLRGAVNKGIKKTIQEDPNLFFTYNNGIAAIANRIHTVNIENKTYLSKINNMRIINGGQTTATLHSTIKDMNFPELDELKILVKLTLIDEREYEDVHITNISRFSNTQNKISNSDLLSNHPFFVKFEKISRRIYLPVSDNDNYQYCYFERMRGDYSEERAKLSSTERKNFDIRYPKKLKFTKLDLAKFYNSWDKLPYIVSKGAEKNFVMFEKILGDLKIDDMSYKVFIAKLILYLKIIKIVTARRFGGYRANIVTYIMALLSEKYSNEVNFDIIWETQEINDKLCNLIDNLATVIQEHIFDIQEGKNIGEYTKNEICWEKLKAKKIKF